jgi:hypothetical protein
LKIEKINIPEHYLAESKDYNFSQAVCVNNDSKVFLQVDTLSLKSGIHFKLLKPIRHDTLIFPGECLSIDVNYYPLDTGLIVDTILIHSCGATIGIPLISKSKARNIKFITSELLFEPTCIGTENMKTFPLAINADPVPVTINSIDIVKSDYTPFISFTNRDLVYQPGDTIFATISFRPTELREGINDVLILHSNQLKFVLNIKVRGLGIGTDYELSHYDLRFIPEILKRKIKVFNRSNNEIYLQSANINPPNYFSLLTSLPKTLKPNSTEELEIRWNIENGEPPNIVVMDLIAGPCAALKQVSLGLYKAESKITIPNVFADPKGNAKININYSNSANYPYNGERFFEGEIIINPRLFLPQKVTSPYGNGFLIKNEIFNDRRIIGFRVEGALPEEGIAAEIHGVAGLAEIDTSHINLLPKAQYWGSAVNNNLGYGIFQLINITEDGLVIHNKSITKLKAVPNPSDGILNLSFEAMSAGDCKIEIYNSLGINEFSAGSFNISEGNNQIALDVSNLKSGSYSLLIKHGSSFAVIKILIFK